MSEVPTTSDARCGACGAPAATPYRPPPPELAPDLDLRPGEPTRSTLSNWILICPSCGAAAPDLTALGPAARAAMETDAYRKPAGPAEAAPFLRWAELCRAAGQTAEAAEATLEAAWAADDAASASASAALRRQAAALWGDPPDAATALRVIDALRRAGEFAQAASRAAALAATTLDESETEVLRFQRARIAARDVGRHLLSSALPPPAHTPHVAQGRRTIGNKRPDTGFWRRLFRE